MISYDALFAILILHFIGDYIVQTRWMATNKSSKTKALAVHATVYGLCLLPISFLYAVVNAGVHGLVDGITSRATKECWAQSKNKNKSPRQRAIAEWMTFLVMGLDQLIHITCLVLTYSALS